MKKFGVTFMTHQPQQIMLDSPTGEEPVQYGDGVARITLPGGRLLTIPVSDFMGCEEIPEESKIVAPGAAARMPS